MDRYLHLKMGLPPVLKAGSSGMSYEKKMIFKFFQKNYPKSLIFKPGVELKLVHFNSGLIFRKEIRKNFAFYRKTPLLVPGVDPFSNANIYVLDQLKAETETDLESTTCPLLSPILH